ncbi:MAG: SDR family NAD(P)-dependent oxidoreductase [Puia sp.]
MKKILLLVVILLILISGHSQSTLNSALAINKTSSENSLQDSFIARDSNSTYQNAGVGYALVAGGSKGIGYAIAEALARRGYNLILIARHMDSLISAKNKLEYDYHVHVEVLSYDLSLNDAATDIAKWCTDRNIPLKMLCNVAGFGGAKDYLSLSLDSLRYMINLNIGSAMSLTLTLLPLLEKNAPSFILNVGSMAGFAPIPVKNLYSATKSAVVFFSYSLSYQLKEKNISVSVLCPGPVFTNLKS